MSPLNSLAARFSKARPLLLDWPTVLAPLIQHPDYETRLDLLLDLIGTASGLPVVALYLADSPESRFHLLRVRRPGIAQATESSAAPAAAQPGSPIPFLGGAIAGWGQRTAEPEAIEVNEEFYPDSVSSIVASPPLDLPRREEYQAPTVVATPVGPLYSVPLMRGEEQIGLIQVGPVSDKPSRHLRQVMGAAAEPLAYAVLLAYEQGQLQEQLAAYEARADVSRQMLRSAFELDEFLNLLLDLAVKASSTQAGFIALADESGRIHLHTTANLPEGLLDEVDLTPGAGFLEWLDEAEDSLYVADFAQAGELGIQTILAVPLVSESRLLGILGLMNLERGQAPAEHSLTLLSIFAEQIQLVLGNVQLFEAFNQQFVGTIHALAQALDARYPHTVAHHRRVTAWALAIGRELGLREGQLEVLRMAGLGHDVGMCGIIEVEHGFQADFYHPTIGASMFDVLPNGRPASEIVATHHEWYDGWGFPEGRKGDEIPVGGRILALAEFLVESTTTDPIQTAMPPSRLVEEVETRRGRQFDPAVVDAWRTVFDRQRAQASSAAPFQPCFQFKGEPETACATCPARTAVVPCWTMPDVRCIHHGDPDCAGCFIYLEAVERARAAGEEVPAPAVRQANNA